MGIIEGPLSKEGDIICAELLMQQSIDYLLGYVISYKENRGLVRRVLENSGIIQEPIKIRAYELAIRRKEELRKPGEPAYK